MSQETDFPEIWNLCSNVANNIHFHYKPNSVKINDQIVLKITKIYIFDPFSHFWGKKIQKIQNIRLWHGFTWVSNLMIQFQEKFWTYELTDVRKDRYTLFHTTVPVSAGGPTSSKKKIQGYLGLTFSLFSLIFGWSGSSSSKTEMQSPWLVRVR